MHKFLNAIVKSQKLSENSKKSYLDRLKVIEKLSNGDLEDVVKNPKKYIEIIKTTYPAEKSRRAYLAAIIAMFRYANLMAKKEELKQYRIAYQIEDKNVQEKYKKNIASDRHKKGYVDFKEIVKMRDTLTPGSFGKLLLSMYTYIPPVRCDFNDTKIYKTTPKSTTPDLDKQNYIILDPPKLIMNHYKTAVTKKQYVKELPRELIEEIKRSLEKHPREYLFITSDGSPMLPNTYIKWVSNALLKIFGKPLTITIIRHSYINSLNLQKLSEKQKEKIACDMCHSVDMQKQYVLKIKKTKK